MEGKKMTNEQDKNICKFNISQENSDNLSVLNFVYETHARTAPRLGMNSVFRLHLVCKGAGRLDTLNYSKPIKSGDLFITFPSTSYCIANEGDLEYYYISFVGLRTYNLLERAGIDKKNSLISELNALIPFWKSSIDLVATHNIDIVAESVLLYSLGLVCKVQNENKVSATEQCVLNLKKIAEDRFSDPNLNLKSICAENFYNPKYASAAFKKMMGVNFSEYLTALRINNASRLIQNGMTSVKQIASLSGYSDALYFSKIFKKVTGTSPTDWINKVKKNPQKQ